MLNMLLSEFYVIANPPLRDWSVAPAAPWMHHMLTQSRFELRLCPLLATTKERDSVQVVTKCGISDG